MSDDQTVCPACGLGRIEAPSAPPQPPAASWQPQPVSFPTAPPAPATQPARVHGYAADGGSATSNLFRIVGTLGLVAALVAIGLVLHQSSVQNHKINRLESELSQTRSALAGALGVSSASQLQQALVSQQAEGYDAGVKSDLRNAATAEETYLTDYDTYATTVRQLLSEGFKYSSANDYSNGTQSIDIRAYGNSSYCLSAQSASDSTWTYDSLNGGIQPEGTTC